MAHMFWNRCIMTVQGHPRSLIMAPIKKRVYNFLLDLSSNLGPILLRFRDIRALVRQKPLFRYRSPIPAEILGCSPGVDPWHWDLQRARHPKLTNHEIIFDDFQPMWSRYLNVTDRQTTCRNNIAFYIASHGNNYASQCLSTLSTVSNFLIFIGSLLMLFFLQLLSGNSIINCWAM